MAFDDDLLSSIRDRFHHVDRCPVQGPRAFFENAGGALHLKSVAETSALYAGYPDNQDRDNAASRALMAAIEKGRADMRTFFNAPDGQVFVDGALWQARLADPDARLGIGEKVTVTEVSGLTLVVAPWPQTNQASCRRG